MLIRLVSVRNGTSNAMRRLDVFVCVADNGLGAQHFMFVNSFDPMTLVRTISRECELFLDKTSTKRAAEEFLSAIAAANQEALKNVDVNQR